MELMFFSATWCQACKTVYPKWKKLQAVDLAINLREVDIDAEPELALRAGVRGIPAVVLRDGAVYKHVPLGAVKSGQKDLSAAIMEILE